MSMLPFRAALAISLVGLPGLFGQPAPDQPVKPVTVCEVLGDLPKYSGKDFAILGRLDCGWRQLYHTCFLAEDECKRPITTEGYVWPTKILIVVYWEEGMPMPPNGDRQIDDLTTTQKLSEGMAKPPNADP